MIRNRAFCGIQIFVYCLVFILCVFHHSQSTTSVNAWTSLDLPAYKSTITGNYNRVSSSRDVLVTSNGNIYVTDYDSQETRVYDADVKYLYSLGNTAGDGFINSPLSLATDSTGNIYITDPYLDLVKKFNPIGEYLSRSDPNLGENELSWVQGIAIDTEGNIYISDSNNSRIEKFTSNWVLISTYGSNGSGFGQFQLPGGLILKDNYIYVADTYNSRIQKLSLDGQFIDSWGVAGTGISELQTPIDLAIDSQGRFIVADYQNSKVAVFSNTGTFITNLTGNGTSASTIYNPEGVYIGPDNRIYISDKNGVKIYSSEYEYISRILITERSVPYLVSPIDMEENSNGDLYVTSLQSTNCTDCVLRMIDHNTNATIWTAGSKSSGTANGTFPSGAYGLAVDSEDNVYVADYGNNRIQVFDNKGLHKLNIGSFGSGNGQFSYPTGVDIDSQGYLYVVDSGNRRVQKLSLTGEYLQSFGSAVAGIDRLSACPEDLDVDLQGNLFVADTCLHRIVKYAANGSYMTSYGQLGTGNSDLRYPEGIFIDVDGSIFISDNGHNLVKKFSSTYEYQYTINTYDGANPFNSPYFINVSADGNLYIADNSNDVIRKLVLDRIGPVGTIMIDSGVQFTNNPLVDLEITASDRESSVTNMWISEDSEFLSGGDWEPYMTTSSYNMSLAEAEKTIYVKFKDDLGNESLIYNDTITLDMTKPTGSLLIEGGVSTTNKTNLSVLLNSSDGLSGVDKMMISEDSNFVGVSWIGADNQVQYDFGNRTGNMVLYVKFMDNAKNISLTYSDSIAIEAAPVTPNQGNSNTNNNTNEIEEIDSQYLNMIVVVNDKGIPISNADITINGINYKTDSLGSVNLGYIVAEGTELEVIYEGDTYIVLLKDHILTLSSTDSDENDNDEQIEPDNNDNRVNDPDSKNESKPISILLYLASFIAIVTIGYLALRKANLSKS